MEFGDSRLALFPEPNAHIQNYNKAETQKVKKVVFQEPYENIPNFYLDNNFKKKDCDCVKSHKKLEGKDERECFKEKPCNNQHSCGNKNNVMGFNFKSLLPLLGVLNNGGANLNQLAGLLNKADGLIQLNKDNSGNLISSLLSNKDILSSIMNLFNGGGLNLFLKNKPLKKELKTTDFEIKNYVRVD